MWKGGLQETILRNAWDEDGDRVYLFGGRPFLPENGVTGAYRSQNSIALTEDGSVSMRI